MHPVRQGIPAEHSPGEAFEMQSDTQGQKVRRRDHLDRAQIAGVLLLLHRLLWHQRHHPLACLGNPDPVGMKVYCPTGDETHPSPQMRKALVAQCFSNTPGRTRTCNPRFRSLRRDDFATPEEIPKSIVSHDGQTTSESASGFVTVVSFTAQGSEKGTDLRIPQIPPAIAMRVSCMFFPPVGFF